MDERDSKISTERPTLRSVTGTIDDGVSMTRSRAWASAGKVPSKRTTVIALPGPQPSFRRRTDATAVEVVGSAATTNGVHRRGGNPNDGSARSGSRRVQQQRHRQQSPGDPEDDLYAPPPLLSGAVREADIYRSGRALLQPQKTRRPRHSPRLPTQPPPRHQQRTTSGSGRHRVGGGSSAGERDADENIPDDIEKGQRVEPAKPGTKRGQRGSYSLPLPSYLPPPPPTPSLGTASTDEDFDDNDENQNDSSSDKHDDGLGGPAEIAIGDEESLGDKDTVGRGSGGVVVGAQLRREPAAAAAPTTAPATSIIPHSYQVAQANTNGASQTRATSIPSPPTRLDADAQRRAGTEGTRGRLALTAPPPPQLPSLGPGTRMAALSSSPPFVPFRSSDSAAAAAATFGDRGRTKTSAIVHTLLLSALEVYLSTLNAWNERAWELDSFEQYVYLTSSAMEVLALVHVVIAFLVDRDRRFLGEPLVILSTGVLDDDLDVRIEGFNRTVLQALTNMAMFGAYIYATMNNADWTVGAIGLLLAVLGIVLGPTMCRSRTGTAAGAGSASAGPPRRRRREVPRWVLILTFSFSPVVVDVLETVFLLRGEITQGVLLLVAVDLIAVVPAITWIAVQGYYAISKKG